MLLTMAAMSELRLLEGAGGAVPAVLIVPGMDNCVVLSGPGKFVSAPDRGTGAGGDTGLSRSEGSGLRGWTSALGSMAAGGVECTSRALVTTSGTSITCPGAVAVLGNDWEKMDRGKNTDRAAANRDRRFLELFNTVNMSELCAFFSRTGVREIMIYNRITPRSRRLALAFLSPFFAASENHFIASCSFFSPPVPADNNRA